MFICDPDELCFPPVESADEDGILAIGGDLRAERLLLAYRSGIFPWYEEGQPIIWWSPDPRFVLFPDELRISQSMRRIVRSDRFHSTWDADFSAVIKQCRFTPRAGQSGTWITPEMEVAYCELHRLGHAHSIEVWQNDELVGGLYGVLVGRCFCGESMFSNVSNASKYALIKLVEHLQATGIQLIDSQVPNAHMESMGARLIPRNEYLTALQATNRSMPPPLAGQPQHSPSPDPHLRPCRSQRSAAPSAAPPWSPSTPNNPICMKQRLVMCRYTKMGNGGKSIRRTTYDKDSRTLR